MKGSSILRGVALAIPLMFSLSVSVSASPAATPLAPPVGSLIEREQQGLYEIAKLEEELRKKLAKTPILTGDPVIDAEVKVSWEDFIHDAELAVSTAKDSLSAELSQDRHKFLQENDIREGETKMEWFNRMTDKFGVAQHPNTEIIFANESPCHLFNQNADGCVVQSLNLFGKPNGQHIKMYLSDDAIGDVYILFHEIAHTKGIMHECSADDYSRSITGLPGGHYC